MKLYNLQSALLSKYTTSIIMGVNKTQISRSLYNMISDSNLTNDDIKHMFKWKPRTDIEHSFFINQDQCVIKVMRWNSYAKLDMHGHMGKNCIYHIIDGTFSENINNTHKHIISSNDTGFICDEIGQHSMKNLDSKSAYTFNMYFR